MTESQHEKADYLRKRIALVRHDLQLIEGKPFAIRVTMAREPRTSCTTNAYVEVEQYGQEISAPLATLVRAELEKRLKQLEAEYAKL